MSNTRPQIACWIDRITGRPTQRQADRPDQNPYKKRCEGFVPAMMWLKIARRSDGQHAQHQNKRTDDLAEQVGEGLPDGRGRAEYGSLGIGIVGYAPVRLVRKPDNYSSHKGS